MDIAELNAIGECSRARERAAGMDYESLYGVPPEIAYDREAENHRLIRNFVEKNFDLNLEPWQISLVDETDAVDNQGNKRLLSCYHYYIYYKTVQQIQPDLKINITPALDIFDFCKIENDKDGEWTRRNTEVV